MLFDTSVMLYDRINDTPSIAKENIDLRTLNLLKGSSHFRTRMLSAAWLVSIYMKYVHVFGSLSAQRAPHLSIPGAVSQEKNVHDTIPTLFIALYCGS